LPTAFVNCQLFLEMIYITQLIYIVPGEEKVFDQFEAVAIPLIAKYNGRLLLRVRPSDEAFIEDNFGRPYEIHLVDFDSEQDFENFKKDEERKKFLHLKEQSIKSSIMIEGRKL
jgi:uncharacterized protein (DUF1330 family)